MQHGFVAPHGVLYGLVSNNVGNNLYARFVRHAAHFKHLLIVRSLHAVVAGIVQIFMAHSGCPSAEGTIAEQLQRPERKPRVRIIAAGKFALYKRPKFRRGMIAHLMMIPKLCPAAFKHAPDKRENYFRRGGGACIVGLHAGKAVRGGVVHCVYKHGLELRFAVFGYYGKYFAAGVFGKYAAWVAVRLQLKRAAGELRGAGL